MGNDSEKGKYTTPNGSATWEYITVMSSSMLAISIGFTLGWMSPSLAKLMAPDSPIPVGHDEASNMAAASGAGHTIAPLLSIMLVDRIGRRNSLLCAGVPLAISWTLILVGNNIMILYVARFLAGWCMGMAQAVMPIYHGELLSPKIRGAMSIVGLTFFNVGILIMNGLVPHVSMRFTASVGLTVIIIFLGSFVFMPESPYFLVMSEKYDDAEAVLEKLRGKADVTEEMELIRTTVNPSTDKDGSHIPKKSRIAVFKLLFSIAGNRKATLIVTLLSVAPIFSGFAVFIGFAHIIFKDMNAPLSPDLCLMIISGIQLITGILTTFFVDRFGRRPLICLSGITTSICLTIISAYFYILEHLNLNVTSYSPITIGAVFVLASALNFGLLPASGIVASEIFSSDIKVVAQSVITIIGGIPGFIVVKYYLIIVKSWGFGHCLPFACFAVLMVTCTALLMWLLPETKRKTLLQIQTELNK